jgi:hypothetical protein
MSKEAKKTTESDRPMVERAKEILGHDFLGVEAIKKLEQELKKVEVNVEFATDRLPSFPYTEEDLQVAKFNDEMLVLRPGVMLREERKEPITLIEFRELFKRDPLGKMQTLFYSFRSDAYDWYKKELPATQPGEINLGWSLVKKNVLDGSTDTNWDDQEKLLRQYGRGLKRKGAKNISIRRRTAVEAVYDELLYYINTGKRLLPYKLDWGQSRTSTGRFICVGYFASGGLNVSAFRPKEPNSTTGVCPCR